MPNVTATFEGTSGEAIAAADTGQPLVVLRGTVTRQNGRAVVSNTAKAVAVFDAGVGGADASITLDVGSGGGYALLFRVLDAGNWFRLSSRYYSYSVQTGTETYQSGTETYVQGYNYFTLVTYIKMNPVTGVFIPADSPQYEAPYDVEKGNYYPTEGYPHFRNDFPDQSSNSLGHVFRAFNPRYRFTESYATRPVYSERPVYTTYYAHRAMLHVAVNDAVTPLWESAELSGLAELAVSANGTSLTAEARNSLGTVLASTSRSDERFRAATRHGFGYAESSQFGNSDGVDNFVLTAFNQPPGVPTGLAPSGEVSDPTPTLSATVSDPDGQSVRAVFQVASDSGFTQLVTSGEGPLVASGGVSSWTPTVGLTGATRHWVRALARDSAGLSSGWSAAVTIDAPLPLAPLVTSPSTSPATVNGRVRVAWTPQPGLSEQPQGGFVFRRAKAGVTEFWSGSVWQSTQVVVSTGTAAVDFPLGAWQSGSWTYAVATADPFGRVGAFCADRVLVVGGGLAMVV